MTYASASASFSGRTRAASVSKPLPVFRGRKRNPVSTSCKPESHESHNLVEAGPDTHAEAWSVLSPLLAQGTIRPSFDISYPLERAADALHHLIDDRPYGTVSLTIAP